MQILKYDGTSKATNKTHIRITERGVLSDFRFQTFWICAWRQIGYI